MSLTCTQCSRVNPSDAHYCYFDGAALDGAARGGAAPMGSREFPAPYVFPSGRVCRNFDQLAIAVHQDEHQGLEALQSGDLASFLGGMGRADLAQAAREAARAPNRLRALDTLLGLFPSKVLTPAKLAVEPTDVNLGELSVGKDRTLNLRLRNQGMRLLCGSITCQDAVWLSLGDAGGTQQKLFQFTGELVVPLHIRGKLLAASPKSLESRLTIDSNGGMSTVLVRATVPLRPFDGGVLTGALSPRQIAEKARAQPREAAVFFENGAVARWYESNGWNYPVKGPSSSGLGAIQQYFEAHGLARPPKVDISETELVLHVRAGESLGHQLEVSTREDRSVFALASTDQPWLKVECPTPKGRSAPVWLIVPSVPNQPGESVHARVNIEANGQQRFVVKVTLAIRTKRSAAPVAAPYAPPPVPFALPSSSATVPIPVLSDPGESLAIVPPTSRRWHRHIGPAALLVLVLVALFTRDKLFHGGAPGLPGPGWPGSNDEEIVLKDAVPRLVLRLHDRPDAPNERGHVVFSHPTMRFGLLTRDPNKLDESKRLTFDEQGRSNNTCIRLDGEEVLFGESPGTWKEREVALRRDPEKRQWDGNRSTWSLDRHHVRVTQTVEIVPGQSSRLLDTCLVRYAIENRDSISHRVGLRFMLDTYIGSNDGVPFTLPGTQELCDTQHDFHSRGEVPDFIQALERNDLEEPGTIANVQLRLGGRIDPPDRVTLGAWPNAELQQVRRYNIPGRDQLRGHLTLWAVPVLPIKLMKQLNFQASADSAVVMYWHERDLEPGATREVGFAYGLGSVAASAGGKLALTVGGAFVRGGDFTVTAYVTDPQPGQRLTLRLPGGLQVREGSAEQAVPPVATEASRPISTVTWKVRAAERGEHTLQVTSNTGSEQSQKVTIRQRSIFD